jgi:methionine--tRNA ligase beta chain
MSEITIEQFFEADLRTAKIVEAQRVEKSKKLIKLQIDIGTEQRQIVAGIAEAYTPEELVGKNIIVVTNLQPATLMGEVSNGMLLAASIDGVPVLATFEKEIPPGTKVK